VKWIFFLLESTLGVGVFPESLTPLCRATVAMKQIESTPNELYSDIKKTPKTDENSGFGFGNQRPVLTKAQTDQPSRKKGTQAMRIVLPTRLPKYLESLFL
jgi:hypothetical protein